MLGTLGRLHSPITTHRHTAGSMKELEDPAGGAGILAW